MHLAIPKDQRVPDPWIAAQDLAFEVRGAVVAARGQHDQVVDAVLRISSGLGLVGWREKRSPFGEGGEGPEQRRGSGGVWGSGLRTMIGSKRPGVADSRQRIPL